VVVVDRSVGSIDGHGSRLVGVDRGEGVRTDGGHSGRQ
jgi:hypothetical protein